MVVSHSYAQRTSFKFLVRLFRLYIQKYIGFCSDVPDDVARDAAHNIGPDTKAKGYFHLCPRTDFLQTLHINNSLYTYYENVFIELDS